MSLWYKVLFSIIFACIGFMVAIQFQSTQNPEQRDTRDLWEVRTEIQNQQKIQQQLYNKLAELDEMLTQYEGQTKQVKVETLKESIEELKMKAGLKEVTGEGVIIKVTPIFQNIDEEQSYPSVSPELLHRLMNELNTYGASDIAIANERITNVTPIRDVNGHTYVNNHPLPPLPVTIKVLAADAKRLLDYMQVSQSKDDFAIENLELKLSQKDRLTLPAYGNVPTLEYLEVDNNETGES